MITKRNPSIPATPAALVLLAGVIALSGCGATPRVDLEAANAAGAATGMAGAVEFRTVGPDGGPLDEPDSPVGVLTLSDALRRAVTTDPELQAALARVRIALADADQSRLLPNPVLNVVLRWGPGKPQIEAALAQQFIQVFQIPRRASAADNRLRQAAANAVTVAIDVAAEVQDRYVAAQASAEVLPLLSDRLSLLDQISGVAKSRLEAGEGTRGDVVTLDAQRVGMQVELDRARLAEREERLKLARLIGEPSSAAAWTLDPWAPPGTSIAPEARWVEVALTQRPEIQSIAWRLKALGDDEALARLAVWQGAAVGVDAQRGDDWFTGPSVSTPLPVFDSGQAARARVTAEQFEARHELTLARRKVVEEVRVAYQTSVSSTSNLTRIRGELIPLQQQRRTFAEDAYRAGQSDITPLYLAEQDLRLARAQAIEVEKQAAAAMVRLQRAVGGPGVANSLLQPPSPVPALNPTPTSTPTSTPALTAAPTPAQ